MGGLSLVWINSINIDIHSTVYADIYTVETHV